MKYTYAYHHNNGAYIYESSNGKKVFNYNNQWFKSMNDVNKYINTTGITLKRRNHNLQPRLEISEKEDYSIRIKEYRNIQYK